MPLSDRRGWSLLETATAVSGLALLLALAVVVHSRYRERAYTRLCHAQQSTLQKQIDSLGQINLDVPMDDIFNQLVASGAIATEAKSIKLRDPGAGEGSHRNYYIMPGSRMVACRVHRSAFLE